MPGGDHCAVTGCNNDRRYPERYIIKDHVPQLKFHRPRVSSYGIWQRALDRPGFKVTPSTRVCSNHFKYGKPTEMEQKPSLYLKGYKAADGSDISIEVNKKRKIDLDHCYTNVNLNEPVEVNSEHDYSIVSNGSLPSNKQKPDIESDSAFSIIKLMEKEMNILKRERDYFKEKLEKANLEIKELKRKVCESKGTEKNFSIESIKLDESLVKVYTGLPSFSVFNWLFEKLSPKLPGINYCGERSRRLSKADEMLLTLMRIRQNLVEEDLAFRFSVSCSMVSIIIASWVPFLSTEIKTLINWPTPTNVKNYYPQCFHKFGTVQAIISFTEIPLQHLSATNENSPMYINNKSHPSAKLLVCFTASGSVSYISPCAVGSVSSKEIVTESDFIRKIAKSSQESEGKKLTVLSDRCINIQELLIPFKVKLIVPLLLKESSPLCHSEAKKTRIANVRIHIERIINRFKEFRIVQGEIPLKEIDLLDDICTIIAALINLQPPVIPALPLIPALPRATEPEGPTLSSRPILPLQPTALPLQNR